MLRNLLGQDIPTENDCKMYLNNLAILINNLDDLLGEGSERRFMDALELCVGLATHSFDRELHTRERDQRRRIEGLTFMHTWFQDRLKHTTVTLPIKDLLEAPGGEAEDNYGR